MGLTSAITTPRSLLLWAARAYCNWFASRRERGTIPQVPRHRRGIRPNAWGPLAAGLCVFWQTCFLCSRARRQALPALPAGA